MVVSRAEVPAKGNDKAAAKSEKGFYDELEASKRKRSCLSLQSCGCLLLAFLALCFLAAAALVAASGLVRVPVLSDLVYRAPAPARLVEPSGALNFSEFIAAQLKEQGTSSGDQVTITLTEGQLTSMLQAPDAGGRVLLKQGQVAISGSSLEIFGQVLPTQGSQPVSIRVLFVPGADRRTLQITEAQIGNVPVAPKLLGTVTDMFLGATPLQGRDIKELGITGIQLGQGQLTLQVDPAQFTEGGGMLPG
ncbi:MAG: hypothetical protein ACOYBJ_02610 [Patescibacteria group bacterium]|jgi:hypothetical protein